MAGGGIENAVGPGGCFVAKAAGVPVLVQRRHDVGPIVPGVVVQGVAEHRAEGSPLQPDDGVGECSVPGFDLLGQPSAQVDAGERPGLTTEEKAEVKALKQEVAELRRANEILKAASAFFAAELGRPPRCS